MTVKQLHLGLGPVRRVNCNNFYANYEKLFRPDLRDTTVFVLSSNDSCVVARSKEAKASIPLSGFYNKGVMQPDLLTLQMIIQNNSRLMQVVDHINQKQRGKSVETASSTQRRLVLNPFDIIENGECIGTRSQYGVLAIQGRLA